MAYEPQASRADVEAQAKVIVEQLGGKWDARGAMCVCPAHDDGTPSLSVRVGRSSVLFHCFGGCDTVAVIRAIRAQRVLAGERLRVTDEPAQVTIPKFNLADKARRIWSSARPIAGTPAELYLKGRGFSGPFRDLRYHPRTPVGRGNEVQFRPAMIAAVRNAIGVIAVHRTFIDPSTGQKASNLVKPKLALGRLEQGAVRLSEPDEVLGLAEGIETAMSAAIIHNIPVWAVLGNERFALVEIPSQVKKLVFLGDRDRGGKLGVTRGIEAQARPGLSTYQLWPPEGMNDWNDVMREGEGVERR